LVDRVFLDSGYLDIISVGHNWKGGYRGNVAKELARGNKFERTIVTIAKFQPARRPYHTTFVDGVAKPRRHKKESPQVGNWKLQLL